MHHDTGYPIPPFHVAPSTHKIMWSVHMALLPAIFTLTYLQGTRWLGMLLFSIISAWMIEAAILALRGRKNKILTTLADGSASLTACLLMLSLPVMVPPWLVFIGLTFALVCGKHLYGGLGMNPFNPAMVGFCFLLISFPALMGQHSIGQLNFWSIFNEVDAATGATLLDNSRQFRISGAPISALPHNYAKQIVLALAWTSGGLWMAYKKYLDWKISASVILASLLTATIFWYCNQSQYLNPIQQLLSGAIIFGAFFIATDPVTAATTPLGRILFGILVGVLTITIRNIGNFPDGFAFAILLANATAPILDNLQPTYR